MTLPEGLHGECDERFAAVPKLLAEQLAGGEHHGVAFAACHRGQLVVDVWGGQRTTADGTDVPWERDSMTTCWSTSKGVIATALHIAMERAGVSYDQPVASVWPGFGAHGKEHITIRQALCHEAAVPQIRDQIERARETGDWDARVAMMEDLTPLWEPGTQNGYHSINFAWLIGELVRIIGGKPVPDFLADEMAGPLGLDGLYIGAPEEALGRIGQLVRDDEGMSLDEQDAAYDARIPEESYTWKALSPRGGLADYLSSPDGWRACIPSVSGVYTARALARLYAMIERGGELDGVRLLEPETVAALSEVQNDRPDVVIGVTPRWRLGYMSGGPSNLPVFGPNPESFGHVGAGGTVGGCDPTAEVSYGLVYDKMDPALLGGPKSISVVEATVAAASA